MQESQKNIKGCSLPKKIIMLKNVFKKINRNVDKRNDVLKLLLYIEELRSFDKPRDDNSGLWVKIKGGKMFCLLENNFPTF